MKKIIFFYFLVFSTFLFAQERIISGTIKDVTTKAPIEGVSVSIVGSNIGTISNSEGNFKIMVPQPYIKLSFSHLSYNLKEYEVKDNATVEIDLETKEYQLDEVVINQNSEKEALKASFEATIEKLENAQLLHTYYREFVKEDGKYSAFSDGILDYYVYTKGKHNTLASDLYVKQSRAFDLRDTKDSEDAEDTEGTGANNVKKMVLEAYHFVYGTKKNKEKTNDTAVNPEYDYHFETKTEANGNSINVVTIIPKKEIEKEYMFCYSITYDAKTKLLLNFEMKYSSEHQKYAQFHSLLVFKMRCDDMALKLAFKNDGGKYVMTYYQRKSSFSFKEGKKRNYKLESDSDVTVLDYEIGDFKLDKSKQYKKDNLYTHGNNYTEEFWKKQNIMLLTDEEENIIKTLNQKTESTTQGTLN